MFYAFIDAFFGRTYDWKSRSGLKEFWSLYVMTLLFSLIPMMLGTAFEAGGLHFVGNVFFGLWIGHLIASVCPMATVLSRRLNDFGWNGRYCVYLSVFTCFIALPLFLIIAAFVPGNKERNKYGNPPRE